MAVRRRRPQPTLDDALGWEETRQRLASRSGGRCEVCWGRVSSWPPWEAHHRLPRGMGGTTDPDENALSRLIVAHNTCHVACEIERTAAAERGLIILHGLHPLTVPLVLPSGRRVYLDDNGFYLDPPDGEVRYVLGDVWVPSAA